MFDFQQKRKIKSILNSRITQGLILLLVLAIGWSAFVRYEIAMEMRDRNIEAKQQASLLEARKEALETKVDYLSSDRGIEAEMRRQFDVALPGEQVIVIVEDEDDRLDVQPLNSATTTEERAWYQFWR
jgi:cell division protein FtsB